MTYSQRVSDGANSSDIVYLEHQIGTTKEKLHSFGETRNIQKRIVGIEVITNQECIRRQF
ncbi:hypothetical protein Q0F98_35180 [Paenibacillus amylolyticus]|nr:hypothetical protein Q0F98_35180 [Paenibacillus amylolyticus]